VIAHDFVVVAVVMTVVMPAVMTVMMVVSHMKVIEDVEPREPEAPPPERRRNPSIQVVVVPGWRIVGNHGRTDALVIILDHLGFHIGRRRVLHHRLGIWRSGHIRPNRQAEIRCGAGEDLLGFLPRLRDPPRVRCGAERFPQFPIDVRGDRVVRDPPVARSDPQRSQPVLRVYLVGGRAKPHGLDQTHSQIPLPHQGL